MIPSERARSSTRGKFKLRLELASPLKVTATAIVALGVAAQVARLTVAEGVAETNSTLALWLAPGSPPVMVGQAMAEVGSAAAEDSDLNPDTIERLQRIAKVAPLQPEPFLVAAALSQRAGDYRRSEQLLEHAERRDPRSIAALYLLAEASFRRNRIADGLRRMAMLTRVMPSAKAQLIPALSEFTRTPGAAENLATILADDPQLRQPLLEALATDPANTEIVLALAGRDITSHNPSTRLWKIRLLSSLVENGEYERAYALWRQFARLPQNRRALIFNPDFRRSAAPPPFNWNFATSRAGLAEPENGALRVLFYGRQEAILAKQLLLLPPGSYRVEVPASGKVLSDALAWTLTCAGAKQPLVRLPVGSSPFGQLNFTVPSGCRAQELALKGSIQDPPQESDVRLGPVKIESIGG